jgi:2TM domain-containing protein
MDDIAYRRARARVEARLAFYRHAAIYVLVNLFLAILNLTRDPQHLWFQWPLFGWGIGLLSHGLSVFSYRWNSARKEQMIQREMERERGAKG